MSRCKPLLWLAGLGTLVALVVVSPAGATYPGRNGLIAFNAITNGQNQIYTVDQNGHGLRQITHGDGDSLVADWSPDGRKIVFEFDYGDGSGAGVEIMNADGSNVVNLTPTPVCCSGQPSFTPDGKRIVFERFDPDTGDDAIWSMKTNGTDVRRVVDPWPNGAGLATDPNVSPDGKTLSFVGFDGSLFGPSFEPAQGLFTSRLNGSMLTQLMPFSSDQAIKQDWSPDGTRLLMGVNANFLDQGDSANIATIRPNGSGFRMLTNYQGGEVNAFAGSYSPDGKWVVFRLEDHGSYALERMRADGRHVQTILPLSSFRPRNIDWGPRAPGARH